MDWFGLTSRFEESMAMMSHIFNMNLLQYRPVSNYNPRPPDVSSETKAILAQGQEIDILLYKLAEKIFDMRWQALVARKKARTPDQIFKCDKDVICFNGASEDVWAIQEGPPPTPAVHYNPKNIRMKRLR